MAAPPPGLPAIPPAPLPAPPPFIVFDPAAGQPLGFDPAAGLPFAPAETPVLDDAKPVTPFQRFWRRFGGEGFIISAGLHAVLLILALIWIVQRFVIAPEPDKFTTGAGGGNNGATVSMNEHRVKPKNARSQVRSPNKLLVKGAATSVSLPEMPSMNMAALADGNPLGAASKGLGGGAGGGEGGGIGVGRGGGRNMVSLFGVTRAGANQLTGTLYDLKKNRSGKVLYAFNNQGLRIAEMRAAYAGFAKRGKAFLDEKYFAAKQRLYASHLLIPPVAAGNATKAFECEKEIQAPGWLAHYEGWITPPETGTFRFAGLGDDALLVRVDGKVRFWGPWTQGGMQTWFKMERDWVPKVAYAANGRLPALGGVGRYCGSWFEMRKGTRYHVEIVIAEAYGGLFSASVLIQEKAKNSAAEPDMAAPLPVFRLAPLTPEELALKRGATLRWSNDNARNFGCEANGLKSPRSGSAFMNR